MNPARLAKIKDLIRPTDKIIMAKKDILPLRFPVEQTKRESVYGKPKGLWYAVGKEWIEWVEVEMPHWLGNKFYRLETTERVLKIDSAAKFLDMIHTYGELRPPLFNDNPDPKYDLAIDWAKMSKDYAGIEIAPYRWNMRHEYMWYYGWDVASGCIWDKEGIKSIKRVTLRKPKATP